MVMHVARPSPWWRLWWPILERVAYSGNSYLTSRNRHKPNCNEFSPCITFTKWQLLIDLRNSVCFVGRTVDGSECFLRMRVRVSVCRDGATVRNRRILRWLCEWWLPKANTMHTNVVLGGGLTFPMPLYHPISLAQMMSNCDWSRWAIGVWLLSSEGKCSLHLRWEILKRANGHTTDQEQISSHSRYIIPYFSRIFLPRQITSLPQVNLSYILKRPFSWPTLGFQTFNMYRNISTVSVVSGFTCGGISYRVRDRVEVCTWVVFIRLYADSQRLVSSFWCRDSLSWDSCGCYALGG